MRATVIRENSPGGATLRIATERLALQNRMGEAYLNFDYPRAEHSARELIRIGDGAGDPWNEWPYATAKLVLFRVLNQNPALKFSPEIDRLRSEILEHGCSLTGEIYVGESLATNAAHK